MSQETIVTIRILFPLDVLQQDDLQSVLVRAVADSIENFAFDINVEIVEVATDGR